MKEESDDDKANNSRGEDDYDTSQGYPILYPETHMMQIKRNVTATSLNLNNTLPPGAAEGDGYDPNLNTTTG